MKIDLTTPGATILKELAQRLSKVRKAQGYTQAELAQDAGIGIATLRRIEGGQDSQLATWIKILKTLERTEALDALLPEHFESPMAQAHAKKRRARKMPETSDGIRWGDEAK